LAKGRNRASMPRTYRAVRLFCRTRLSTPYSGRACSRPNGWVSAAVIRVCGNGIGISPNVLARRFQPFTAFIILKSSPNLIILNLALPIVDGFAMLSEGRGENATIGRQVRSCARRKTTRSQNTPCSTASSVKVELCSPSVFGPESCGHG
jgi:hypothetical protein